MDHHNLPVVTKKMWRIVRALLFMLRKGIKKSKIMLELNMMMKRGKIAGKAMIGNLVFHHQHRGSSSGRHDNYQLPVGPHEYEFSCSNSPAHFPFNIIKRRHKYQLQYHHDDVHSNQLIPDNDHDVATLNAVNILLEKLSIASPMLPSSGKGSMARQVRVIDSPFPFQDIKEENSQVDRAADEFIQKFYKQLNEQIRTPGRVY